MIVMIARKCSPVRKRYVLGRNHHTTFHHTTPTPWRSVDHVDSDVIMSCVCAFGTLCATHPPSPAWVPPSPTQKIQKHRSFGDRCVCRLVFVFFIFFSVDLWHQHTFSPLSPQKLIASQRQGLHSDHKCSVSIPHGPPNEAHATMAVLSTTRPRVLYNRGNSSVSRDIDESCSTTCWLGEMSDESEGCVSECSAVKVVEKMQ